VGRLAIDMEVPAPYALPDAPDDPEDVRAQLV
jgi:hypothetical protein